MKSLYVISKHILYNVGGAEKSILRYINKLNYNKKILLGFNYPQKKITENLSCNVRFLNPILKINQFYFFEYFINKLSIRKSIKDLSNDHIISYGIYFPVVINHCNSCFKELHIRSETDLGIFINYNSGFKYFIKMILKFLEFPFEYYYKKELKIAILSADRIICNSKFMQTELLKMYGKKSKVIYPSIEINNKGFSSSKEGIVFIGNSTIKGLNLVKKIAKKMPEHDFFIFGKNILREYKQGNIIYYPWENDVLNIYKRAKLVIVPSQWKEAYGRVAKEAILLNIPVIVSDIGGLKEAVDYDENKLVKNYKSRDEWIQKIQKNLLY
jgi:glycosyltransferase involved in cell wall biosynthesis